jgi:hypothetical protein
LKPRTNHRASSSTSSSSRDRARPSYPTCPHSARLRGRRHDHAPSSGRGARNPSIYE